MRKLLLASYTFRTGEAEYQDFTLLAVKSSTANTDQDDVNLGYHIFNNWFTRVYPESELISCIIKVTVNEHTLFPNVVDKQIGVPLSDIFSQTSIWYLNQMGITDTRQAAELSDENLLRVRGIGHIAIQKLRNLYA